VEKNTYRGTLLSVLLTKYYLSDKITKNPMVGTCSTHRGEKRWGNLRERDHL